MDVFNNTLVEFVASYKRWVQANPQLLADVESTVRCFSYFTAGRFNNSSLASELIYSMPNLIILFNDLLISSGKYVHLKIPKLQLKIKIWLTIIEYTEALFEVSAHKLLGTTGKWLIILFIQLFKTVMRLLLVHAYKENVIKSPSIAPLNRDKLNEVYDKDIPMKEGYQLKRTGTIVRSIRASRSVQTRVWAPISFTREKSQDINDPHISKKMLKLAESLYIVKPLLHLGCLSATGKMSWQPWFLSLIVDLTSLELFSQYGRGEILSKEEWEEIYRRRIGLFLYILRSPFYNKYSRARITAILKSLSTSMPVTRLVTEPLEKYLPHWQKMYFYMWSR